MIMPVRNLKKNGDRTKRFEIICDGVWRHLLGGGVVSGSSDDSDDSDSDEKESKEASAGETKNDDIPDELIRRMGAYVEYQLDNIVFRLPDDYFDRGMVAWGSMPDLDVELDANEVNEAQSDTDVDASKDGTGTDEKDAMSGMDFINDEWVKVLNDAGEPYYWNMESDQVTWTEPAATSAPVSAPTMINSQQ
eukprot:336747_1